MAATQEDALLEGSPYKATIVPIQDKSSFKLDDADRSGRAKARQYATAIIVNIAALAAGTVMGWSSPASMVLTSPTASPLDGDGDGVGEPISADHFSWLASINFLSGVPGTLLFGALADRLGRRVAGLVVAVPFALSWVLISTTDTLLPLYAARILAGIASGGALVICPLYVGEAAEDEHRGALGTFLAVGINAGILFTFMVGAVTSYRVLPLVCLILPALYFLGMLRLPETAVYLVKRGRHGAARKALTWYRGAPGPHVDAELEDLQAAAKLEESAGGNSGAFTDLFTHRGSRRAITQNLVSVTNQQFCGVIAVLSYTEDIFREAGSSLSPATSSIIVAALLAVMSYVSSFLMNRAGRNTLLILSNAVMAVSLAALGACFYAKGLGYDLSVVSWLPLVAMSVYMVAFAIGLGPVPLVVVSETFSTKVRGVGTSLSMACQTICAFTSTKLFNNLKDLLGFHGCLWFFAGVCVAGMLYTWFFAIETKGKRLDAILREFDGLPATAEEGEDDDDVFRKEALHLQEESKA